jgi:hypothetical protein
MAIESKNMTIEHFETTQIVEMNSHYGTGEAGTFDGTTTTAATKDDTAESLNNVYHVMRLWDTFTDGATWQHALPENYVDETDISVTVHWTTDTSTTGSAYVKAGLSYIGSDDIYGDDTDSVYTTVAQYTGPTSTNEVIHDTFTFSGANIFKGMDLAFILIRLGADANDTINDEYKVIGITWEYTINKKGTLNP